MEVSKCKNSRILFFPAKPAHQNCLVLMSLNSNMSSGTSILVEIGRFEHAKLLYAHPVYLE